ncbi:hypothetical protein [Streptomyces sp. NPDC050564]|uniref:hypothetical protein n=1 Tax=Streptomyces sp. NPDC050564 TaxID=3365631 RepID=UPI00379713C3
MENPEGAGERPDARERVRLLGGDAGQKQGPSGKTYTARYCHNYLGDVVGYWETDTGYLNAGDNWFVCQIQYGENTPVGDAKNKLVAVDAGRQGLLRRRLGLVPRQQGVGRQQLRADPGSADLLTCDLPTC